MSEILLEADQSTMPVEELFDKGRRGARAFAADLLSYWGKLQYARGVVDSGAHDRYLQECFNRNIFKPDELTKAVESAVSQFVSKMEARENQLLVEIRADLNDSDMGKLASMPTLHAEAEFRRQYQSLLVQVTPVVAGDIGIDITKEMLDWTVVTPIVTQIGAELAARLGISGTVLGVGASSGPVTIGISFVVGVLVDKLLDWVFRQAGHNPEGEIASKVVDSLDRLEWLILDGVWVAFEPLPSAYEVLEPADGSPWAFQPSEKSTNAVAKGLGKTRGLLQHLDQLIETRSRLRTGL